MASYGVSMPQWNKSIAPWRCGSNIKSVANKNGRHFADNIFKCIFLNENILISLQIWLRFVPKVQINSIPALVQIMAWRRPGDKPLSEPMMVNLLMHTCLNELKSSHQNATEENSICSLLEKPGPKNWNGELVLQFCLVDDLLNVLFETVRKSHAFI